ncbi:hypothetical protein NDU88_000665 [Pleurodeles waltl]|uniref:Uncharacterized protein n=1 Tax=Pleurodeles waltl TaxID=8319 RepID=A0AAV7TFP7_PLEWA|nr:hypothetical protein NDU88_000665 [Pleurodeles waltl]
MESRGAGRVRAWRGGARSFLHVNRDRVIGRAVVTRSVWHDAPPRAWGLWELESHAVREREGEEKEDIQRTGEVGGLMFGDPTIAHAFIDQESDFFPDRFRWVL